MLPPKSPAPPAAAAVPIAVVGASCIFPGSSDARGFWRDILGGRDLVTDIPPERWLVEDYYDPDPATPDRIYAKRGAFLGPVDFDALGFGLPPSILPVTDTTQLMALIVAQRVLDEVLRAFPGTDRRRTSVILGATASQELMGHMVSRLQRPVWVKALRECGLPEDEVQQACTRIAAHYTPWQEATFPGLLGNVIAGRVANRLDLGGTNCVTDAACASSLSAVTMAVHELQLGSSDLVITGGADTMNDPFMFMCFSKTPALSPSGDCRPFSDDADGTLLGEGVGMVALKRLADAERDGDRIYAVLRGIGSSSDGRAKSVYAPRPEGQADALRRAYAAAGYGPETVELVEAHGTGTKAGDAAELEGLRLVFSAAAPEGRGWCALGSVKSQIGHTKAAAGAASLFKAVMALHHKVLPPTIKVRRPNGKMGLESSPFYLNTRLRPWVRGPDHPRRASVSAFGFGGSNFHVALEEWTGPRATRPPRLRSFPTELVLLSAEDGPALARAARAAAARTQPGALAALADETQQHWLPGAARLAVVAADEAELAQKLEAAAVAALAGQALDRPDGLFLRLDPPEIAAAGGLCFLFPGQGSQHLEMGRDLLTHFEAARAPWDAAAGLGLHLATFPRPGFSPEAEAEAEAALRRTDVAQPAICLHSLSLLALLDQVGLRPDAAAGHSFGEVMALHAAGALRAEAALDVARARGALMAEAARQPGAMTAVVAGAAEVEAATRGLGVVLANDNAPDQTVLSGPTEAIAAAEDALREAGLRFTRLPVATAFHSPVVSAAVEPFARHLAGCAFSAPTIPVYRNETAAPYGDDVAAALAGQLAAPVRWVELIRRAYADGMRCFVEVGPGSVLTGLVGRILEGSPHQAFSFDQKGRDSTRSLWLGLGRLAAAGRPLHLAALTAEYGAPVDPATRVGPRLAVSITGGNVGNPYPPPGGAAALPPPNPPRRTPPAEPPAPALPAKPPTPPTPPSTAMSLTPPAPPLAPAAAPAPASSSSSSSSSLAWIAALQESQRQTALAHTAFQTAMMEAHTAFLRASEVGFASMASMAGGAPLPSAAPLVMVAAPVMQPAAPLVMTAEPAAKATAPVKPAATPVEQPTAPVKPAATPVEQPTAPIKPAAAPIKPAAAGPDLGQALLAVVAEKTGYPAEMLRLDMELEGDLGIDSIKRVEILSALQERLPSLPELDAAELGGLHTLAAILGHLGQASPAAATPATAAAAPAAGAALEGLLLAVVAEKTGYPAEMLRLDMELEGDLGIDSIKRVEILSALQERAPGLPDIDGAELAGLSTLGHITRHLGALGGAPATAPPSAPTAALEGLLLGVVAEKTGYPAEMLRLDMELEGDLGIDSIKRVEILSALQERAPGLPDIDGADLAALSTLGHITAHLNGLLRQPAPPATAKVSPPSAEPDAPPTVFRTTLSLHEAPPSGLIRAGLLGGRVYLSDDGQGLRGPLALALKDAGVQIVEEAVEADAAVFLGGLRPDPDAASVMGEALALARTLARRKATGLVTVQDTGGGFGLLPIPAGRATLAGLAGLARTAAIEWDGAAVKVIDLCLSELRAGRASPADLARRLADELVFGGPEREVGLPADGRRLTLADRPTPAPGPEALPLADGDVVLITGGARGVTAACALALAAQGSYRFALLGRSPLVHEPTAAWGVSDEAGLKRALASSAASPAALGRTVSAILAAREVRRTLDLLVTMGSEARYLAEDVTDYTALAAALQGLRQHWGPIAAVVHGAGVIADKRLEDKTQAQLDLVWSTKVTGAENLLAATAGDPLKVLCFFTSVAARVGNEGQADYAMANEALNKLARAEQARRPGCRVTALGWGPWEGGMVSPALRRHFAARGLPMLPLALGGEAFVAALGDPSVELVLGGEGFGGAAPRAAQDYDIQVDVDRLPFLLDHAIDGLPVIPVALVLEWFARAAGAFRPDLHLAALRDVRVVRGIPLPRPARLRLEVTHTANRDGCILVFKLRSEDSVLRYSATAEMTQYPPDTARPRGPALALEPWAGREIYDGHVLFHGPRFQVIRDMAGVSDQGIEGELAPGAEVGWAEGAYQTDPAAVDGGLQLAVLWSKHMIGGAALPTHIQAVRSFGLPVGRMRAVVQGREQGRKRTLSDLYLFNPDGGLVTLLEGVETHCRPDPA